MKIKKALMGIDLLLREAYVYVLSKQHPLQSTPRKSHLPLEGS